MVIPSKRVRQSKSARSGVGVVNLEENAVEEALEVEVLSPLPKLTI
jgi:hypothetical protein